MYRSIVSSLTIITFLGTILVAPAAPLLAQEAETPTDAAGACLAAQHDVETSYSAGQYAVGGFLCGIFGFAFAAASTPKPPVERFVGKSPEYVSVYTTCYESGAKSKNIRSACVGWAVGAAVVLSIYLITDSGN